MSLEYFILGISFIFGVLIRIKSLVSLLVIFLISYLFTIKKIKIKLIPLMLGFALIGFLIAGEQSKEINFPGVFKIKSGANFTEKSKYFYSDEIVIFVPKNSTLEYGDKILIEEAFRNENEFYSKRAKYITFINEPKIVGKNKDILYFIFNIKEGLKSYLEENLSFYPSQIFKGIILGENPQDEVKEIFKNSGLLHLLVVSGQNLTILTLILWKFLKNFFHRKVILLFLIVFILFLSILIDELATWRAGVMAILVIIFQILGRPVLVRNLLLSVILIFLIIEPKIIHNLSFQLSLLAVIGLFYFSPILENFFSKFNLPKIISEIIGVQLFLFPFLIYNFKIFSFSGFLSNLLILPIFPLIFMLSIFSLFLIWLEPVKILIEFIYQIIFQFAKIFSLMPLNLKFNLPLFFVIIIYGYFAYLILRNKNLPDFRWEF